MKTWFSVWFVFTLFHDTIKEGIEAGLEIFVEIIGAKEQNADDVDIFQVLITPFQYILKLKRSR